MKMEKDLYLVFVKLFVWKGSGCIVQAWCSLRAYTYHPFLLSLKQETGFISLCLNWGAVGEKKPDQVFDINVCIYLDSKIWNVEPHAAFDTE